VSTTIVPLAALGDPTRLQPLAEAIFGTGDRRRDWLARKLDRECVDPSLSRVAIEGDVDDPSAWRGYVLVGTPPSRRPAARTAGTGVIASARGRGIGRALVRAALEAVADAGLYEELEILAEDGREPFYERLGFARERAFATLLAFGRGMEKPLPAPLPWDPGPRCREIHGFLAEAWARTPSLERGTDVISTPHGTAILHVCRENRAFAIHRTLVVDRPGVDIEATAIAAWDAWLDRIREGTPALIVGVDAAPSGAGSVSSVTAAFTACEGSRWIVAQRGTLVRAHAGQP
jgi:GNAT superfamily N-acetyltransferase